MREIEREGEGEREGLLCNYTEMVRPALEFVGVRVSLLTILYS